MENIFILSCESKLDNGGIYKFQLQDDGKLIKIKYFCCDRPMYGLASNNKVYVLLRKPFYDDENSGLICLDTNLTNEENIKSTNGKCACHLCIDKDVFIANYLSGNIVKLNKKVVCHTGHGVNEKRQSMPHTHCVIMSNDKKFILCCDLGLDTLFCYDKDLNLISKSKINDGYGIRHAVFSKNGDYIYAISEIIPAINIFSYKNGIVKFIKKIDIFCNNINGDGAAIRISADGNFLYVSLRVENKILVYSINNDVLILKQSISCGGDSPRDFQIFNDKMIITNENSNNVVVLKLENNLIKEKISEIYLDKPLCCFGIK